MEEWLDSSMKGLMGGVMGREVVEWFNGGICGEMGG